MSGGIIHIAGPAVRVGMLLRQRCGWCGAMMADYDLERIAVPEGQEDAPGTWGAGELVLVDGNMSAVYPHVDGTELPANACALLDPAVTT